MTHLNGEKKATGWRAGQSWGMDESVPLAGDPFDLARSSCLHAVAIARDVFIDEAAAKRLADGLDKGAVSQVMKGHLGENCDTVWSDFRDARDAADFAIVFALLQFGHGFRHELHQHCGRGAAQTITRGLRTLRSTGDLGAARMASLSQADIQGAFKLPSNPSLDTLTRQLCAVVHQAAAVLKQLGMANFDDFARLALADPEAKERPATTAVRYLAQHVPAFNDQGFLHDQSRVVLVKKATLAAAEVHRLAAPHDRAYDLSLDLGRAVAPIDNVVPAMLVYHGVLRLSASLRRIIHEERRPLERGPREAELRAVALIACDRAAAAGGGAWSPLELSYYLWLSGKAPGARPFPRHHTPDTVFY